MLQSKREEPAITRSENAHNMGTGDCSALCTARQGLDNTALMFPPRSIHLLPKTVSEEHAEAAKPTRRLGSDFAPMHYGMGWQFLNLIVFFCSCATSTYHLYAIHAERLRVSALTPATMARRQHRKAQVTLALKYKRGCVTRCQQK